MSLQLGLATILSNRFIKTTTTTRIIPSSTSMIVTSSSGTLGRSTISRNNRCHFFTLTRATPATPATPAAAKARITTTPTFSTLRCVSPSESPSLSFIHTIKKRQYEKYSCISSTFHPTTTTTIINRNFNDSSLISFPNKNTNTNNTITTVSTMTKENETKATTMSRNFVTKTTSKHYEDHTADSYEDAYFYEPGAYMQHLVQLVGTKLGMNLQQYYQLAKTNLNDNNNDTMKTNDNIYNNANNNTSTNLIRILDIGGGTGNFAQALLDEFDKDNDTLASAASPSASASGATITTISPSFSTKRKKIRPEIVVVDPFLNPTTTSLLNDNNNNNSDDNDNTKSSTVRFVKASAEAFLEEYNSTSNNDESNNDHNGTKTSKQSYWWWRQNVSQILLKEVVHHLEENRVGIFRGMYNDLCPTITTTSTTTSTTTNLPSILIITRPQVDIDYPLWDAARQVWKDNQPSSDTLRKELIEAGFENIEISIESYPCNIALSKWQSMIQNRFWSTFSKFSDEELLHASTRIIPQEWKDRIINENGTNTIYFEDRLVFITAEKK